MNFNPLTELTQRASSAEEKEIILKERANKIAIAETKKRNNAIEREVVVFGLEKENYAIEAVYVKEVYPLIDVTVLPCVPPWVYGVINVRRKIYSVIDLKTLFDLDQELDNADHKVIILEEGNISFGILTNEIYGVQSIDLSNLQSQLPTQTHKSKEFIKGITNDRVIVLNGDKLLHSESLIVDEVIG